MRPSTSSGRRQRQRPSSANASGLAGERLRRRRGRRTPRACFNSPPGVEAAHRLSAPRPRSAGAHRAPEQRLGRRTRLPGCPLPELCFQARIELVGLQRGPTPGELSAPDEAKASAFHWWAPSVENLHAPLHHPPMVMTVARRGTSAWRSWSRRNSGVGGGGVLEPSGSPRGLTDQQAARTCRALTRC